MLTLELRLVLKVNLAFYATKVLNFLMEIVCCRRGNASLVIILICVFMNERSAKGQLDVPLSHTQIAKQIMHEIAQQ